MFALALSAGGPIHVLTTISTFNSFVTAVGGSHVSVSSMVPIGASPEDYQPTPADIARLHDADVLVENGLGLEVWLNRTVDNAKNPNLRVIVCTERLTPRANNPHLWMDPVRAVAYVRAIRDGLSARDPEHRDEYARNTAAYERRLQELQRTIAARIRTVRPADRTLLLFHNAFQYYSERFGLRTVGVIENSPGREPSPKELADLVAVARRNHVRAVFVEPEYSPKLARAVAASAGIRTIEQLYDDSIGTDPRVRDYESMLLYDTETIVKALR